MATAPGKTQEAPA
jgi:serine/threonine protein kinase